MHPEILCFLTTANGYGREYLFRGNSLARSKVQSPVEGSGPVRKLLKHLAREHFARSHQGQAGISW